MSDEKKETAKIIGPEHTYEFQIMDTITGVGVFHQYLMRLGKDSEAVISGIKDIIGGMDSVEKMTSIEVLKMLFSGDDVFEKLRQAIIKVLSLQDVFELCAVLMAGAKIDGKPCDDMGMCDLFRKQPHQMYTAILMAIAANYPDYFPFLEVGAGTEETP